MTIWIGLLQAMWKKPAATSRRVQSAEIMVVICPVEWCCLRRVRRVRQEDACTHLDLPERRSALRKMTLTSDVRTRKPTVILHAVGG